jgi:hypothetical protein
MTVSSSSSSHLRNIQAMAQLVKFRAYILEQTRAGFFDNQYGNLDKGIAVWIRGNRSRSDFTLLALEAHIFNKPLSLQDLCDFISITRNTAKTIVREALSFGIIVAEKSGRQYLVSASREFYQGYLTAQLCEWQLMSAADGQAIGTAFRDLKSDPNLGQGDTNVELALQILILSRSESVKTNRSGGRKKGANKTDSLLGQWVSMNSFNRELLFLIMHARITSQPLRYLPTMKTLAVSRNSLKQSIFAAQDIGVIDADVLMATEQALDDYLQWHLTTFARIGDRNIEMIASFFLGLEDHELAF